MAKSAAVKRLERILGDEDYGPKLARLNRRDEAHVLDLIDRNKGREARKEILRLDEARRERRRGTSTRLPTIEQLRAKARAKLHAMWQSKEKYVAVNMRRNVKYMTPDELKYATSATQNELEDRAREPSKPYPDLDFELNVFWYH